MTDAQVPARLGLSGRLAAAFQSNPLTPVLALAGLMLGLLAATITPREEEPQIDVTMANVIVPFDGASARDVEQLVATPLEQKLGEIEGVKHVYSISRPGAAVLTVEYEVGVPRQSALLRLYNQVFSNQDWMPQGVGVGAPLVKPKGIDDVPVMAVTLWSDDAHVDATALAEVAHTLEAEFKRIPGTRDVYTIGAPERVVLVTLDAAKLAAYQLSAGELLQALRAANVVHQAGERIDAAGAVPVTAGQFLASAQEVAALVIGNRDGKPLLLSDVASVASRGDLATSHVWFGSPPGRTGPATGRAPAVTIAIAKKPGSNASDITSALRQRIHELEGELIPAGVHASVTRDYGQTAADKASKLIQKLFFATASVVLLVLFALGWREAIVIGSAVVLTLAVTLFASWAMGFTLNRVSLFALIFSIGILVDDAVVVVENIHRRLAMPAPDGQRRSLAEVIPPAVDEVGGPTILATFTVIAALMPMAFVSGLMGPYMRPIPINASVGMLLSLAIALIVTPWLALKLLRRHGNADTQTSEHRSGWLDRLFQRVMSPFLRGAGAGRRRGVLFGAIALLVVLAASLAALQLVVMKMLPLDNKSELQVVVDLPEGSTLEQTTAVLTELAAEVARVPEVLDWQGYAGTAAPINFNGLVRQYYLREAGNLGDLQVNLVDKHLRSRQSHAIALALRPALAAIAARHGAALKVVEVPPGPPVLSPIVAEVYGPDYDGQRRIAQALARGEFARTQGIVDIDTTVEAKAARETFVLDRERAARLGVTQASVAETLALAVAGMDASFIHDGAAKYARPVRLRLPAQDQAALPSLLALKLRSNQGQLVPLSELVRVERSDWDGARHHKDGLPVVYVTADEAGRLDSPLYGMFSVVGALRHAQVDGSLLAQNFITQPHDSASYALKWDGEWQITYETFRDMGLAYAAGMILIYLLVVGHFRSYLVPLVIMAPIPLTLIGVMPGHALLGKQFTATSMIGMIALAGIIVRNSILLVDFIKQETARGVPLVDAVIDACAVRAKPIALTGVAAMLGALFILDDPIFNGLAISLIFGIFVSTILTLVVIPLLYFGLRRRALAASADEAGG
ncbi:MAG: efflux RND transporter permease subunit [Dokdonella sp.]|uniref:efflux RND transporter permease subunit n=1 Tax=Dokdonella sp. TaxID=2291710 RepID=UPI0025C5FC1A|nr:efflux RND transporter permease subunit [Dokdonella sp.]MBZ0221942.1 efflux RND transporter permease subunit [Dokdonella sp.]MCC7255645.1 efflux RND transporter permease subunit [Dokdonella sp.]